jgi:hypothetical protein
LLGGGAGEELQGIEEVKGGGLAVRRWGCHLGHVWTVDGRVGLEGVEPKGRRKKKKKDAAKAKAGRHEEGEGSTVARRKRRSTTA